MTAAARVFDMDHGVLTWKMLLSVDYQLRELGVVRRSDECQPARLNVIRSVALAYNFGNERRAAGSLRSVPYWSLLPRGK